MAKRKVIKYTPEEIISGNRLIAEFMGFVFVDKYSFQTKPNGRTYDRGVLSYFSSWDKLMDVVDKIEEIGASMEIRPRHSYINWFYSPKKTITYTKGAGGGGGWTDPRKPFDCIGGKHYSRCVGVGETAEKFNVQTKIEAVYSNVVYFIEWYNKKVNK